MQDAKDSQSAGQPLLSHPRPRITLLRELRMLSRSDLAEKVGTTADIIADLENGWRDISIDMLVLIARVLKAQPFDLIGEDSPSTGAAHTNSLTIQVPEDPATREAIIRHLRTMWAEQSGLASGGLVRPGPL